MSNSVGKHPLIDIRFQNPDDAERFSWGDIVSGPLDALVSPTPITAKKKPKPRPRPRPKPGNGY